MYNKFPKKPYAGRSKEVIIMYSCRIVAYYTQLYYYDCKIVHSSF